MTHKSLASALSTYFMNPILSRAITIFYSYRIKIYAGVQPERCLCINSKQANLMKGLVNPIHKCS